MKEPPRPSQGGSARPKGKGAPAGDGSCGKTLPLQCQLVSIQK